MPVRFAWQMLVRVAASLVGGGVGYTCCLAAFLLFGRSSGPVVQAILWFAMPVVTAAGFAAGVTLWDRLSGTRATRFLRAFPWPLVGCAIGAGVVYPFGPMLIVFGMFIGGPISILLRDLLLTRRQAA